MAADDQELETSKNETPADAPNEIPRAPSEEAAPEVVNYAQQNPSAPAQNTNALAPTSDAAGGDEATPDNAVAGETPPVPDNAGAAGIAPSAPPQAPVQNPAGVISKITNPTEQQMNQEDLQWAQDLANRHISPKTYGDLFHDQKSTMGQIGLAFSILLGGIGSGLTHQSNAALDIMNKAIDRDFEAQKLSKENANNYMRLAYEHEMQLAQQKLLAAQTAQIPLTNQQIMANKKNLDADTEVKSSTSALNKFRIGVIQKLSDYADGLPPGQQPIAQGAVNNVVAPALMQKNQQDNAKAASLLNARTMLRDQPQPNQAAVDNPLSRERQYIASQQALRLAGMDNVANNNDERHFPGLGNASVPLTSEDRGKINAGIQFQNQLQGYINWSRAHSGDLRPADINEGTALASQLQAAYREATHGGVYNEGEQHFIGKIIHDTPTEFLNEIRSIPQLNAVQRESHAQLNQLIESKGFQNKPQFEPTWVAPKENKGTAAAPAAPQSAPIATNANGEKVIYRNGQWVPYK